MRRSVRPKEFPTTPLNLNSEAQVRARVARSSRCDDLVCGPSRVGAQRSRKLVKATGQQGANIDIRSASDTARGHRSPFSVAALRTGGRADPTQCGVQAQVAQAGFGFLQERKTAPQTLGGLLGQAPSAPGELEAFTWGLSWRSFGLPATGCRGYSVGTGRRQKCSCNSAS